MKVEQLNSQDIDFTKPQVVVNNYGEKWYLVTNKEPIDKDSFCGVNLNTGNYSNQILKRGCKPENANQYPIELKLTIESDFELCNLLHRTSCRFRTEYSSFRLKYNVNDNDEIFQKNLFELAKERNLYKND